MVSIMRVAFLSVRLRRTIRHRSWQCPKHILSNSAPPARALVQYHSVRTARDKKAAWCFFERPDGFLAFLSCSHKISGRGRAKFCRRRHGAVVASLAISDHDSNAGAIYMPPCCTHSCMGCAMAAALRLPGCCSSRCTRSPSCGALLTGLLNAGCRYRVQTRPQP